MEMLVSTNLWLPLSNAQEGIQLRIHFTNLPGDILTQFIAECSMDHPFFTKDQGITIKKLTCRDWQVLKTKRKKLTNMEYFRTFFCTNSCR